MFLQLGLPTFCTVSHNAELSFLRCKELCSNMLVRLSNEVLCSIALNFVYWCFVGFIFFYYHVLYIMCMCMCVYGPRCLI